MSRLLGILDAVGQSHPAPLGFSVNTRKETEVPFACIGIVRKVSQLEEMIAARCLTGIVLAGQVREDLVKTFGDTPWGAWLDDTLSAKSLKRYKELGCDFIVAHPDHFPVAIHEEEMARFIVVPPDADDRFLRAIESLPVDGVVLAPCGFEPPIMVRHLVSVGTVSTMFEKHLLVQTSFSLKGAELAALRDMGVSGMAIELDSISPDDLGELGKRIATIPEKPAPPRGRAVAVAPYMPQSRVASAPPDDEEEEDEF